jgi:hypothetical protein
MVILKPLGYAYRELIANRRNQIPFWILFGFLPTFVIERTIVDNYPGLFLRAHGTHVHHFTYGIIVLALTGFISLVWDRPSRRALAAFYGIGLALAFDEFGMWLHLTSNYNLDQSVDVMVGILVFLVSIVYGIGIIRHAVPYMRRSRRS